MFDFNLAAVVTVAAISTAAVAVGYKFLHADAAAHHRYCRRIDNTVYDVCMAACDLYNKTKTFIETFIECDMNNKIQIIFETYETIIETNIETIIETNEIVIVRLIHLRGGLDFVRWASSMVATLQTALKSMVPTTIAPLFTCAIFVIAIISFIGASVSVGAIAQRLIDRRFVVPETGHGRRYALTCVHIANHLAHRVYVTAVVLSGRFHFNHPLGRFVQVGIQACGVLEFFLWFSWFVTGPLFSFIKSLFMQGYVVLSQIDDFVVETAKNASEFVFEKVPEEVFDFFFFFFFSNEDRRPNASAIAGLTDTHRMASTGPGSPGTDSSVDHSSLSQAPAGTSTLPPSKDAAAAPTAPSAAQAEAGKSTPVPSKDTAAAPTAPSAAQAQAGKSTLVPTKDAAAAPTDHSAAPTQAGTISHLPPKATVETSSTSPDTALLPPFSKVRSVHIPGKDEEEEPELTWFSSKKEEKKSVPPLASTTATAYTTGQSRTPLRLGSHGTDSSTGGVGVAENEKDGDDDDAVATAADGVDVTGGYDADAGNDDDDDDYDDDEDIQLQMAIYSSDEDLNDDDDDDYDDDEDIQLQMAIYSSDEDLNDDDDDDEDYVEG